MGVRASLFALVVVSGCVVTAGDRRLHADNGSVDLSLVLAVDCSYSVDADEYRLQMEGLADAFAAPELQRAMASGPNQRIAVALVQWSSFGAAKVAQDWTVLDGAPSSQRFAAALRRTPRLVADGSTSVSTAIDASNYLIAKSPYRALRSVIDISSDGINNNGGPPEPARDRAVAAGITINGLVIMNDVFYLDDYFRNHVVGGDAHFVVDASDYSAYPEAIMRKLLKEIEWPSA